MDIFSLFAGFCVGGVLGATVAVLILGIFVAGDNADRWAGVE